MELLKLEKRPAKFAWKDITIFYRTEVTVGDKFSVDTSGAIISGDKVNFSPWEFYKTMIRTFVTGWEGVTADGHEVPYSFENLMERLPADMTDDLVMNLGLKIAQDTGFLTPSQNGSQGEADLKNV